MPRKVFTVGAGAICAKRMGARVSSGRAKVAPAARRKKSLRAYLRIIIHPPAAGCVTFRSIFAGGAGVAFYVGDR